MCNCITAAPVTAAAGTPKRTCCRDCALLLLRWVMPLFLWRCWCWRPLGGAVSVLMASKPGVVDAVVSAHPGFLVSLGLSIDQCQATRKAGYQLRYAAACCVSLVLSACDQAH